MTPKLLELSSFSSAPGQPSNGRTGRAERSLEKRLGRVEEGHRELTVAARSDDTLGRPGAWAASHNISSRMEYNHGVERLQTLD